jgi:hypothetical protein
MGMQKEEKVVTDRTVLGMSNIGNHITDKWHTPISAEYYRRELSLNHAESFHVYIVIPDMNITC